MEYFFRKHYFRTLVDYRSVFFLYIVTLKEVSKGIYNSFHYLIISSKEPFLKMLLKIDCVGLEFGGLHLLMIYEKESNLFFEEQPKNFRLDIMGNWLVEANNFP